MNLLFSANGRIGRAKWWLGELSVIGIYVAVGFLLAAVFAAGFRTAPASAWITAGVIVLVTLILCVWIRVCVTVKRYHDRNKSGWWFFILFIPVVGGIWQLVECGCLRGDDGVNDYGDGGSAGGSSSALEAEIAAMRGDPAPAGAVAARPALAASAPAPAFQPARAGFGARPSFGQRGL